MSDVGEWSLFKYVEEAEFGPGFPVNTVFIMGKLLDGNENCQGMFIVLVHQAKYSWGLNLYWLILVESRYLLLKCIREVIECKNKVEIFNS